MFVWSSISGYLVMSCNNTLFFELIEFLLTELTKNTSTSTTRTFIQCVGAIRLVKRKRWRILVEVSLIGDGSRFYLWKLVLLVEVCLYVVIDVFVGSQFYIGGRNWSI